MKDVPLVTCLTNVVAADITANMLLAVGARPAMMEEAAEAAELTAISKALLVNLGTVHPRQAEAMKRAVRVAAEVGIPWVLDPVAVNVLSYRREVLSELLAIAKPAIVRGNAEEINFLLANGFKVEEVGAVLATAKVDRVYIPDGTMLEIAGGVEMLQVVTATGCSQGAICAAFLGMGFKPKEAAEKASRLMKRAGELAFAMEPTPGSFRQKLIDEIWDLSHQ